jgi:hypothetical protein
MDPDPTPDHALFVSDFQGGNKNKSEIFCLLLFKGIFTSFFKDKSHKTVDIKVFLTIFA